MNPNRSRAAVATFATAALLVLAGCATGGSDHSGHESDGPSTTVTASSPRTEEAAGAGARADLTGDRCESRVGVWSFAGRLTNPGDRSATYTVDLAVAEIDGGAVKGTG